MPELRKCGHTQQHIDTNQLFNDEQLGRRVMMKPLSPEQDPQKKPSSVREVAGSLLVARNSESLGTKAFLGSLWTIGGYGLGQGLRLISNLILSRLLFPEAFGLMSLVQVVMQGIGMFSDIGIGPSIVRSKRGDDPDFLNTAWTIQVVRGFFMCGVVTLASRPAALFFEEPMLLEMLPWASLSAIGLCFTSTKFFTARRHLAVASVTLIELTSQVLTLSVLVALAFFMRSVWSLVIGNIVGTVVKSLMTQFLLSGPVNRLRWEKAAVEELYRFGRWIFLSTALTFLASHGDRLLLGKFLPLNLLGVYSVAVSLASIPDAIFSAISQRILFPSLARVSGDAERFRTAYEKVSEIIMVLTGSIVIAGLCLGPRLIQVMYDSRYDAAAWMFLPLIITQWFSSLNGLASTVPLVFGNSRWGAIATLSRVILLFPVGWAACVLLGPEWGICIISATVIPQWLIACFAANQYGLRVFGVQFCETLLLTCICAASYLLLQEIPLGNFRASVEIIAAVLGVAVWTLIHPRLVADGIRRFRQGWFCRRRCSEV